MGTFVKLTMSMGDYTGESVYLNVNKIQSFNAVLGGSDAFHPEAKAYVSLGFDDGYYVKETPAEIERAIEEAKNRSFSDFSTEIATALWNRGIGL